MNQQFLIIALVIVPVLSVCLGFTVHYAIRPLVEMLLDAIHDLGKIAGGSSPDRVARLEADVHELRSEVKRLRAGAVEAARVEDTRELQGLGPGSA